MPANLTDVDTYTTPVQVPAGSDPRALTYLLTAFQALANRTHFLALRTVVVVERTFVVSPHRAQFTTGWTRSNNTLTSTSNNAPLYLPLDFLPTGSVIKRVKALVTPGANTMGLELRSRTLDFTTPGSGSDILIETVTTSGTSLQVLTTTPQSETVNHTSGKHYVAVVTANSGAGASNDTLFGFQIVADLIGNGAY